MGLVLPPLQFSHWNRRMETLRIQSAHGGDLWTLTVTIKWQLLKISAVCKVWKHPVPMKTVNIFEFFNLACSCSVHVIQLWCEKCSKMSQIFKNKVKSLITHWNSYVCNTWWPPRLTICLYGWHVTGLKKWISQHSSMSDLKSD